jgi:site-specific DNA-methyltransferase (cytosine-N4-specific)
VKTYYQDDSITLLLGNSITVAATLEPQSIQSVVTSPPYFGLRDYGVGGQLGAEETPAEFVSALVAVFDAIRPALADDGTLWVNLGDSYSSGGRKSYDNKGGKNPGAVGTSRPQSGVSAKNLLGIPWRFAFAMQDTGWILRNDIIWAKPNAMPESVTDRFSKRYEHVFLFAKNPRYYFDLDAVRVPHTSPQTGRAATFGRKTKEEIIPNQAATQHREGRPDTPAGNPLGKNPGDVWDISTKPFQGAHFATFPPELPERCILASTRPGDTVLDPFSGAGTTGMVARQHGRKYIGIDLNAEYHDLALETRLTREKEKK